MLSIPHRGALSCNESRHPFAPSRPRSPSRRSWSCSRRVRFHDVRVDVPVRLRLLRSRHQRCSGGLGHPRRSRRLRRVVRRLALGRPLPLRRDRRSGPARGLPGGPGRAVEHRQPPGEHGLQVHRETRRRRSRPRPPIPRTAVLHVNFFRAGDGNQPSFSANVDRRRERHRARHRWRAERLGAGCGVHERIRALQRLNPRVPTRIGARRAHRCARRAPGRACDRASAGAQARVEQHTGDGTRCVPTTRSVRRLTAQWLGSTSGSSVRAAWASPPPGRSSCRGSPGGSRCTTAPGSGPGARRSTTCTRSPLLPRTEIRGRSYDEFEPEDVMIITCGHHIQPGESRLDVLGANVEILDHTAGAMEAGGLPPRGHRRHQPARRAHRVPGAALGWS